MCWVDQNNMRSSLPQICLPHSFYAGDLVPSQRTVVMFIFGRHLVWWFLPFSIVTLSTSNLLCRSFSPFLCVGWNRLHHRGCVSFWRRFVFWPYSTTGDSPYSRPSSHLPGLLRLDRRRSQRRWDSILAVRPALPHPINAHTHTGTVPQSYTAPTPCTPMLGL